MAKINLEIRTMFIICFVFLSTMTLMAGCGVETSKAAETNAFMDVSEDGREITATFNEAAAGCAAATGITIKENEYLVINRNIAKGSVHVRVIDGGSDIDDDFTVEAPATIDYVFDSEGIVEYELIEPGDYMIRVDVDNKATGNIVFTIKDCE